MNAPTKTAYSDLPEVLPVFPLSDVILLPGGRLPLNVFEPHYMALVEAALKQGRMFGLIQPVHDEISDIQPKLYSVGTVGRIVHFSETENDQYFVVMYGACRFRVTEELDADDSGFRRLRVNYSDYAADLQNPAGGQVTAPRQRLMDCLTRYVQAHELELDLRALDALSVPSLVVTLSMALPFESSEKQALLEAETIDHRFGALCTLMEMGAMIAQGMGDSPQ